jgi:hypothetical protein
MGDDDQDETPGTPAPAQAQVTPVPTIDTAFSTKATESRLGKWEWATLVIILALLILISIFHNQLGLHLDFETSVVLIAAAIVLYGANKTFVFRGKGKNDNIPYVIAFDSVCFVIIGLVATILACSHWQTGLLLAGSCLLIGGFFGLLFGYPQGVAQQVAQAASHIGVDAGGSPTPPGVQQVSQATNHGKTLLADSAATLGKVITGFTLAKLDSANKYFEGLCRGVGPALGAADSSNSHVLAGVIIAYFLATGFLSGLFLPSYFMRDQF